MSIVMRKQNFLHSFIFAFVLFANLTILCRGADASIQEIKLPNGFLATADYRIGKAELPTIVVLHGFLSTRNFLTVSNLVESLANESYTVLAPNLSLGVNLRQASLACEAIHTHSIDDDVAEIKVWIDWLIARGHTNIVLVGHSYGSLHGLLYVLENDQPAIKKLIAASLVDVDHAIDSNLAVSQIKMAKAMVSMHDNSLKPYHVSYCKKYVTPPKAFLSYASWSRKKILNAISQIKIPVEVILGSEDKRMGEDWPTLLKNNGVTVKVIKGANHFFYNEQEFDLLDVVLSMLRTTPQI